MSCLTLTNDFVHYKIYDSLTNTDINNINGVWYLYALTHDTPISTQFSSLNHTVIIIVQASKQTNKQTEIGWLFMSSLFPLEINCSLSWQSIFDYLW